MDDVLVIGAGPAGLLAAWVARQRGARVRLIAAGIGSTHIAPGWIGVWAEPGNLGENLQRLVAQCPEHPYALAGPEALEHGLVALREACEPSGLRYVGDLEANFVLPTALGARISAAVAPESFAAGDLRQPGSMLLAGPRGWRDFYPTLCAGNLQRFGIPAIGMSFNLPEMRASNRFDPTSVSLARLFDRPEVRAHVAEQVGAQLDGATRVGFPAVLGLERAPEAWHDLQDRLGVPVFEIPTLPPSVPGMRLFNALKRALASVGVSPLLDMTVSQGGREGLRASGVDVPGAARALTYRAAQIILATGGLYGGGIASDYSGCLTEVVFDLPLQTPDNMGEWFDDQLLAAGSHQIQTVGVYANSQLQPVDPHGKIVLENVRVAGRLLAGHNPMVEGSTEGIWLATAYHAACAATAELPAQTLSGAQQGVVRLHP